MKRLGASQYAVLPRAEWMFPRGVSVASVAQTCLAPEAMNGSAPVRIGGHFARQTRRTHEPVGTVEIAYGVGARPTLRRRYALSPLPGHHPLTLIFSQRLSRLSVPPGATTPLPRQQQKPCQS